MSTTEYISSNGAKLADIADCCIEKDGMRGTCENNWNNTETRNQINQSNFINNEKSGNRNVQHIRNTMVMILKKRLRDAGFDRTYSQKVGILENILYVTAASNDEYADVTTLEKRLHLLLASLVRRRIKRKTIAATMA